MERIEIDLNEFGIGTVKIGKEDISDCVSAIELSSEAGSYTTMTVHFIKMPVTIRTYGEVVFKSK